MSGVCAPRDRSRGPASNAVEIEKSRNDRRLRGGIARVKSLARTGTNNHRRRTDTTTGDGVSLDPPREGVVLSPYSQSVCRATRSKAAGGHTRRAMLVTTTTVAVAITNTSATTTQLLTWLPVTTFAARHGHVDLKLASSRT